MVVVGWGGVYVIVGWGCRLIGLVWIIVVFLIGGMVICFFTVGGGGFIFGWGGLVWGGGGLEGGWGCNMVVWVVVGFVWFWIVVLGCFFVGLY